MAYSARVSFEVAAYDTEQPDDEAEETTEDEDDENEDVSEEGARNGTLVASYP